MIADKCKVDCHVLFIDGECGTKKISIVDGSFANVCKETALLGDGGHWPGYCVTSAG